MTKTKPSIKKKILSWENTGTTKICDKKKCDQKGSYKAPKSRINLNNYYFFCLEHVKEYNKSWDFYKGLTVNDIELSLRKDIIWDRPSWPLSGNPGRVFKQVKSFLNSDYNLFENEKDLEKFIKNNIVEQSLNKEEQKSMNILSLNLPLNLEKIKKAYKKLVKIYHPDVNKDDKEAEKKFKNVNQAYRVLLKRFLINNP